MNPETGQMFDVVDDDAEKARRLLEEGDVSGFPLVTEKEAHERGLIMVTREQAAKLAGMSLEQRQTWAANVRKQAARDEMLRVMQMHPAARCVEESDEEQRRYRNARKRARRGRR